MKSALVKFWKTLKQTFTEFIGDDCPRMAAALAYYTIFSLPPLLIVVIMVTGFVMETERIETEISDQLGLLIGESGVEQIQAVITNANRPGTGGGLAKIIGLIVLIFGATTAFAQLQVALNKSWGIQPSPDRSSIKLFVFKRLLSFGMVVAIAFLLLVSLLISAFLAAFSGMIEPWLPSGITGALIRWLNSLISFAIIVFLFAAILKVIPDARTTWRSAVTGALFTSLLFLFGKYLMGVYLAHSNVGNAYGAAGSLAIVLIWVFYSANIVLLGAEFTQAWARQFGHPIQPVRGAIAIGKELKRNLQPEKKQNGPAPDNAPEGEHRE